MILCGSALLYSTKILITVVLLSWGIIPGMTVKPRQLIGYTQGAGIKWRAPFPSIMNNSFSFLLVFSLCEGGGGFALIIIRGGGGEGRGAI